MTPADVATIHLAQLVMPSAHEIAAGRRRLHRKAAVIGALGVSSYVLLVFGPSLLPLRLLFAGGLVIAAVATATSIMHDANHGAYSVSRRVNRIAGWSSDLLGASSFLWRIKHNNLHHGNPNVVGYDTDIEQAPFARLAPTQPWRPYHRYQHIYMWGLYGLLSLSWFVLSDFRTLIRRRQGLHSLPHRLRPADVALIVLGKFVHLGWAIALPLAFHPWWGVLTYYLVSSWLVGFMLANIFQLAHCVDRAEFFTADAPRRGSDFELHQLRTTVDIRCRRRLPGAALRWLAGGLDCQIEHHLAPKLPHTVHPSMADDLQAACVEHGIEYRVHPGIVSALRSHAHWLRQMGAQPTS
jgi:linoleoyl-CoA desaturase